MKISKTIIFLITMSSFSAFSKSSIPPSMEIFCQSGGFLYNSLTIKEKNNQVYFHTQGSQSSGTLINKIQIPNSFNHPITDIRFKVPRKYCSKNLSPRSRIISCKQRESITLSITDRSGDKKIIIKNAGIEVFEKHNSKENFAGRLLIKEGDQNAIAYKITDCIDLTEFD